MATQAKVTFTALDGTSDLTERILTLHQNAHTVQIGRASKTPSKGLQAAVDNAWFDIPVMSRNHAEISFDTENKIVTIRDIGSMHGTYVNTYQLRPHESQKLNKGDMVVFGAEVKRNTDTFPACVFEVNFEILPFKYIMSKPLQPFFQFLPNFISRANISYAFPEESDEEDYEVSDDEEHDEPSSVDGVSIESPPHKAPEANNTIDLTRDDSPVDSDVECTGEAAVEHTISNVMAGRPADIDRNDHPVSVALCTGNSPILVDSDAGDGHFSSDSDDQSEVDYPSKDTSSVADSLDEQEEQNSEDEENSVDDMDEEDAVFETRDFADKPSEQASRLADQGLMTMLNMRPGNSELDDKWELGDEDEDDESDFGLSDAGAEGIRALFVDGLIDNTGDYHYSVDDESGRDLIVSEAPAQLFMDEEAILEPIETPKRVTFVSLPSEQSPELGSSHYPSNILRPHEPSPIQTSLNARQPSPSDAAMVKTAVPSTTLLDASANSVNMHQLKRYEFQSLPAQSLGDKTGKHTFFAAREDNRARSKLNSVCPDAEKFSKGFNPTLETRKHLDEQKAMSEKRERSAAAMARFREMRRQMDEEAKSDTFTAPETKAVNSTIRIFSNPSYLNDHTQAPKSFRLPSPEPDMTSAVTFNQNKASMASANNHASSSGRSGLSINDIIDRAASDQNSKVVKHDKRKAVDISEAAEDEFRVWASSSSAMEGLEGSAAVSAPTPPVATPKEQSETASSHPTEQSEQRPAKRLRKIVESVGYVALGGATLFGALVLSAPDFL